jgi:hypothetical protein
LKNSPRPKKPRMSKSKIKTMMFCFVDIRGFIHFECVSEGTTVNRTLYMEVLIRLNDAVRRKRGDLWRDRSLIFTTPTRRHILRSSVAVFSRKRHLCQLTSVCFQNWRACWKESVCRTLRTLNHLWKECWHSCSGF